MKKILILTLAITSVVALESCVQKKPDAKISQIRGDRIDVSSVEVKNGQLIIHGNNFKTDTQVVLKKSGSSYNFTVESISSNQIVANGIAAFNFATNSVFDLVLSSANASFVYPITFTVANNTITAAMLTSMGASAGQVLKYNGTNWAPSSITNTQTYLGTWNANTNVPDLSSPSSTSGDYYIVSAAGTINSINYAVGDWIISNGYNWEKISNPPTINKTTVQDMSKVRIYGANTINYVELSASTLTGNRSLIFPDSNGSNGQVLTTDGAGILSWATVSGGGGGGTPDPGSVTNIEVATTANIAQSKIANLTTDLASKEPTIVFSSATNYFRGDKTWQTLDTSVVPENVANLYFTNARVLGVSLTGFSATSSAIVATDSIAQGFSKAQGQINTINSAAAHFLLKDGTDSITGAVNVGVTGVLTITNGPALPTDAVNKAYVDGFGQWNKGASSSINYTAGNVGIGTSTPGQKLDVNGDALISGMIVGKGSGSVANNTVIGFQALGSTNTSGSGNTVIGHSALKNNTTGSTNTAIGVSALESNTFGSANTATGYMALRNSNTSNNTANGFYTLNSNTSGMKNTALGAWTLNLNTTGSFNTGIGESSLYSNTIGSKNTGIGQATLQSNVAKDESTAIGYYSMYYADDTATAGPTNNTAVGAYSLQGSSTASANTGTNNTAIGHTAMKNNTSGSNNTVTGYYAMYSNDVGSNNTAYGSHALHVNKSGSNTAVGAEALYSNSTGHSNVGIGRETLYFNTTGIQNLAIGTDAGRSITTGNYNVVIGSNNGASIATLSNHILISDGMGNERLRIDGAGNVGIGTTSPGFKLDVNGSIAAVGALQAHSDKKLKKNISPVKDALEKLKSITGVYYDWRIDEFPEIDFENRHQMGVIAQDVEKVFPEAVTVNQKGIRSVAYTMLIAPLIEGVKELYQKILGHDNQLSSQARQIASMKKEIDSFKAENKMLKDYLCQKDKTASICK